MEFLKFINAMILAPVMLGVLFFCGIFYFIKLRGKPITSPCKIVNVLLSGEKKEGVSPFKSLCVALAGTLGVGNIVGVATALHAGGAGSVFWMLVSSLAAMIIKYAEVVLAIKYREYENSEYHGGAAYYIRGGLGKKRLAVFFSFLCIVASFTLGNVVQTNAVASAFESEFNLPPAAVGIFMALIAFFVIYKGFKRIADFTFRLIPILSVSYVIFSIVIIAANYRVIPSIAAVIIKDAFTPNAAFGGIMGFLLMSGMRYGVIRGIGSNEAGCGTAPTAHAASNTDSAVKQGFWGVFEVFVDTVLLCTLTAFVILIYSDNIPAYDGILLAIKAYEGFYGAAAGYIISISIFFFALATVICWSYYAMESIRFITSKDIYRKIYIILYCAAVISGAVLSLELLWEISDLSISLMTVINCICIMRLSPDVALLTRAYFNSTKKRLPDK